MQNPTLISLLSLLVFLSSCQPDTPQVSVERWAVFEHKLEGPAEGNPYMEVDLWADFTQGESRYTVPGFYDGEGTYRIRFSPPEEGSWSFKTRSNREELAGKEGSFTCVAPSGRNHGPLKVVNTYYLEYADGSPFFGVGTTAYQWTSVDQETQEQTLETLGTAPFNKIRMCVFPKHYRFGNDTEPWIHPFLMSEGKPDFTRPEVAFFQNFDRRVAQLLELGIEADVILFHPYDIWGYFLMGHELNERYVRYMIARLSAYRNVWWSLANEWDIPEIKVAIDWEAVGTQLQREDPHQRLRGIHNWYNTEDHFYDHSRPWITHTCTQTAQFYHALRWREMYQKPLLFDEMRYEGNVTAGWGNLSGEEMASYFWMAGLSGGYPTHGDTFDNHPADSVETRWWGKGGKLMGTSPPRIAYFRSVMEKAPVKDMVPVLKQKGNPRIWKPTCISFRRRENITWRISPLKAGRFYWNSRLVKPTSWKCTIPGIWRSWRNRPLTLEPFPSSPSSPIRPW
jgi:hypothetical protein